LFSFSLDLCGTFRQDLAVLEEGSEDCGKDSTAPCDRARGFPGCLPVNAVQATTEQKERS